MALHDDKSVDLPMCRIVNAPQRQRALEARHDPEERR
jgi:hypothetical protein